MNTEDEFFLNNAKGSVAQFSSIGSLGGPCGRYDPEEKQ